MLAGYRRRALGWFLTTILLTTLFFVSIINPPLVPLLLVIVPLALILQVAVYIDAFLCGRRSSRRMLGGPFIRYLAGAGLLVVSLGVGRLVTTLLAQLVHGAGAWTYVISSHGMAPTFIPRDRILTNAFQGISRWDLVVYHPPVKPTDVFPGRVVGLPGEKIEIANGAILVNDKAVDIPSGLGPYVQMSFGTIHTATEGHPITLAVDEYFILGDNSTISFDGRLWPDAAPGHQLGAVPRDWIVGRVTAIYFPLNRMRRFN